MKKRDKRKAPAAPQASGMAIDTILAQIASMKDNAKSFLEPDPADPEGQEVWKADIAACEAATAILSALQDEGIRDPEQVRDLIHDYNALAEEYQNMYRHYEKPEKPIQVGTAYICPNCKKQLRQTIAGHCWACGKRLNWFLH